MWVLIAVALAASSEASAASLMPLLVHESRVLSLGVKRSVVIGEELEEKSVEIR